MPVGGSAGPQGPDLHLANRDYYFRSRDNREKRMPQAVENLRKPELMPTELRSGNDVGDRDILRLEDSTAGPRND
jgi:hypothetical protein